MADNLGITVGTDADIATDDAAGVHYQKIKLANGTTDSTTMAEVNASNELQVRDDDANTDLNTIAGAVAGTEMQVDVVASLPAGTNAIGKLAANSGVDIGDVDVTSIAAGDNNIGNVDIASIAAGDNNIGNVDIVSGTVDTVTSITNDVNIADGGNSITVDGTVTANLSATDNTVLDNIDSDTTDIKAAVEIIDNAIDGTEMQVDVVAALPAGDNNIGNVDVASALPAGTNNIGSVMPYAQVGSYVSGVTSDITDTTATSVIAAQGAGVVIYVTTLMVSNSDASTGTVVNITDGSGGTTKWTGYAGPLGGGFVVNFNVPLVLTANTALYAACETTGANVFVNATGFKI